MSHDFGELKTQILDWAHRPDLGDDLAAEFVELAEGMIARRLRAAEMISVATIDDTDRVTVDEGLYNLPQRFLEARSVYKTGSNPIKLEPVSLKELRQVSGQTTVAHYAVISATQVEFRGVPSTTDVMEFTYFQRPIEFVSDTDTNTILDRHPTIYLHAGLAMLYEYTQDLELRDAAIAVVDTAIETLNEQAGRLIGGQNTAGGYCLSSFGAY